MNTQTQTEQKLRALWGASKMPFQEERPFLFEYPELEQAGRKLTRYIGMRASGLITGPNGCGKSIFLDHLLHDLPEQEFCIIRLSHTTLTGSDMIRRLCRLNGLTASIRRSDNLHQLLEFWHNDGRIPVLAIDEAQNLNPATLEELRLLNCEHTRTGGRDPVAPFVLLLCGDDDLMPTIELNIHHALRSRLTFYIRIQPLSAQCANDYCTFQWKQVGVQVSPFDQQATNLLHAASEGLPRAINQIAINAIFDAIDRQQKTITAQNVQQALELTPWIGKRAP
jgi:type II secretory pathway predicted ATPase ExeA